GERQIVGTVKNAVVDGASRRGLSVAVNPDRPDVLLDVRLRDGVLTVSIDLAGRPMHLRGYRGDGGLAPMKENLAAALVMLCRHQSRTEPLLDPMAGSGTIAIEAAAMGLGCPVWVQPRVAACERMVSLMSASPPVAQPLFSDARPLVFANDNDPRSVDACRNHVRRAGMVPYVQCTSGDFQNIEYKTIIRTCESRGIGTTGVILTNPPYGERLSNPELHALYRDFGSWCRQFAGWRAGILVANPDFEEMFGGKARIRKPLSNGPIRSTFLLYDL
ncbi:MAG: hypothetical protein FWD57_15440, partial [Polyangiaceae bacterium]|nr:hypothetical protein [Polyangiaceae bacterium]